MRINCKKTLLVGAIAASMAALTTQAGLTHRYNFGDPSTPQKDLVGTANATLMNMTSANIGVGMNSVSGTGLYFNNVLTGTTLRTSSDTNGQYVSIPTNVIAGAKALTFESWTDLGDSQISPGAWCRIFDIGDPTYSPGSGRNFITYSPHTGENPVNNRLEFNVNGNGQTAEATGTEEGYHHIVAVVDCTNGFLEVYDNGVRTAHANTSYQISNVVNKVFWLGRSEYSGDYYLYGYLQEFRIYDRALSGVEVAADYAVGNSVVNPNLTTTLGAVTTVYLSDPGHILELHSATTAPTADFANAGFIGLNLLNAPGFTLTSSATNIATISTAGLITGLKPGTATITASYGGKSATLLVTVDQDTIAPTVLSIDNLSYDRLVQVTFSKPVDPVTAQNLANYSIDQGVTISRAVLNTNGTQVILYTSQFDINSKYTLTVNNVKDTVLTPNVMQGATGQFGTGVGTLPVGAPLVRNFWTALNDTLANGMNNVGYPYTGATTQSLANGLTDTKGGHGDNYFTATSGWLIAPTTDTYHFALACDDDGAIYVSPDDSEADLPATATLQAAGWSPAGHFLGDGGSEQYTGANSVSMVAGQRYFFRVLMRNGTGGDNFDVAWNPVSVAFTDGMASIPAADLQPCLTAQPKHMVVSSQPANVQIGQNNDATFTVGISSLPKYTGVQWYSISTNGVTNVITGATSLSYTDALASTNDNGLKFFAVVSNLIDTVTSSSATLSVSSDNIPPQLVSAIAGMQVGASATNITVYFNERMLASTAGTKGNYTISGLTVSSATYDTNTLTNVYLTVSTPMTAGAAYTLTVANVKDLAGNVIDTAHKSVVFHAAAYAPGYVVTKKWNHSVSTADDVVAWMAANPKPDGTWAFAQLGTSSWSDGDWGDNICTITEGLLVPPVTGDYVFYDSSDDSSNFYLDTTPGDVDPNNLVKQCSVSSWTNERDWAGSNGGGNQKSSAVTLQAGQKYYFRETWAQGGGGAGFMVDWVIPGTTAIVDITGPAILTPATVDLSSVTVTTNPVAQATIEGHPVTFSAAGTGLSQFGSGVTYQWLKNGVAIAGATKSTYTIPRPGPLFADNGALISCVVSEPLLSKTSTVAVLTVAKYTNAQTVVSAGAFVGSTSVGVRYGMLVDQVTGLDITKYTLPGYTIQSAAIRTNANMDAVDGDMVELTVSPAIAAGATLTVKNVKDIYGNVCVPTTVPVGISAMMAQDVVNTMGATIDPMIAGITEPSGSNSFRITAGGSDIWGNGDCCHFVYQSFSGDFDLRARVANLQGVNGWTKAGLMVRETLSTNSVMAYQVVTANTLADGVTAAQNTWAAGIRMQDTNGAADMPFVVGVTARPPVPTYPDAWVRITREGNLLTAWHATNATGTGWMKDSTNDYSAALPAFGDTLYVGICVTAHDNSTFTVTDVYDFSVVPYVAPKEVPTLSATLNGANVVISWDSVMGAGCTLIASDDLLTWAPAGLTVNDNGVTASVTVAPTAKKFYQLMR